MFKRVVLVLSCSAVWMLAGCGDDGEPAMRDAGDEQDAGGMDGGSPDAANGDLDAGNGTPDAGDGTPDAGAQDAGGDAGSNGGPTARIYFNNSSQDCSSDSLNYVDTDQTEPTEVISLSGPDSVRDLTVDENENWIYFTFGASSANDNDRVRRIHPDGTGIETLATYTSLGPIGIAVDASSDSLYWLATGGCSPCPDCGQCSRVVGAGLTGANPSVVHTVSGNRNISGLTLDRSASRLYFSDIQYEPSIAAVDTNGNNFQSVYTRPVGESPGANDLAVDTSEGKLYWLDEESIGDPADIKRANLDGSNVETLLTVGGSQAATPRGIAIDPENDKLYWTESGFCGDPASGRIRRANMDGTGAETVVEDLGVLTTIDVAS